MDGCVVQTGGCWIELRRYILLLVLLPSVIPGICLPRTIKYCEKVCCMNRIIHSHGSVPLQRRGRIYFVS